MKTSILSLVVLVFFIAKMTAQTEVSQVKVGDVFVIGNMTSNSYKFIHFPRANFIIKRGGIANYNKLSGQKVVITNIDETHANHSATIQLLHSRKFFKSHQSVKVNLLKAIKNKELLRPE